jgi:hypothetical protein
MRYKHEMRGPWCAKVLVVVYETGWSGYTLHGWRYEKHSDGLRGFLEHSWYIFVGCCVHSLRESSVHSESQGKLSSWLVHAVMACHIVTCHVVPHMCKAVWRLGEALAHAPSTCPCDPHHERTFLIGKVAQSTSVIL